MYKQGKSPFNESSQSNSSTVTGTNIPFAGNFKKKINKLTMMLIDISIDNLLAAQPTVTRGSSYHFDVDITRNRIIYTSGRAVYMRDISSPDIAYAFTEHTINTTVAKISSDGNVVASGGNYSIDFDMI